MEEHLCSTYVGSARISLSGVLTAARCSADSCLRWTGNTQPLHGRRLYASSPAAPLCSASAGHRLT